LLKRLPSRNDLTLRLNLPISTIGAARPEGVRRATQAVLLPTHKTRRPSSRSIRSVYPAQSGAIGYKVKGNLGERTIYEAGGKPESQRGLLESADMNSVIDIIL
jgi:hypothetical protein